MIERNTRSARRAALIAFASCALAAPALAQRGARLPELERRAVWDAPLAQAPAEVRAALERARAALRDAPPPARDRSGEATSGWAREALEPWLTRRRAALEGIDALVEPLVLRGGPRERVLATVLRARVIDDLIEQLDGAPIAREVERDPQLLAAYRAALASAIGPLVEDAARAYRVCADAAPVAPAPMRAWAPLCAERASALRARAAEVRALEEAARAARADPARGAGRVPEGCTGVRNGPFEHGVRPPREEARRELAIVLEGEDVPAAARAPLARALARRFGRDFDALVPHAEVERARRLARAGRWRAGGPVCAAPPTAAAVLAEAHPHLVVASVSAECRLIRDEGEHCMLSLRFDRLGTHDRAGLPEPHEAYVGPRRARAAAWIAAAGLLAPLQVGGLIGGFSLEGAVPSPELPRDYVEVRQTEDDDPRLRVATTIRRQHSALRACFRGEGIAALRVAFTLSAEGAAGDVTVTEEPGTLSGAPAAVARVRECVARTLERAPFVCPPDGTPTRVEARLCIGGR